MPMTAVEETVTDGADNGTVGEVVESSTEAQLSADKPEAATQAEKAEKTPVEKKRTAPKKQVRPSVVQSDKCEMGTPLKNGAMQWQRVVAKEEVVPTVEDEQQELLQEQPVVVVADPIVPDESPAAEDTYEQVAVEPDEQDTEAVESAPHLEEETQPAQDRIDDEQEVLQIEDYEMAARFAFRGRISRGVKVGKISREACRLAQLMHPDQSLSTILENALLTRIYLENRDAFDAMAVVIEKKGGHIKC